MRISSAERREQLLSATVELMRREGVQSVTMRAIAKEADAPLAATHYCFSNKDELMEAAAEAWFNNLRRYSSEVPAEMGLRAAVETVAEGYWSALEEETASILAELELILWATRTSRISALSTKIYPSYEKELGKVFSAAAERSGDRCLIGFPEVVRSFLMIYDGAAIQYMADPKSTDHRALYFMMVDALLLKAGV